MNNNTTQNIRNTFLDYFVKNEHTLVSSSSLIPHNDPSLMFVNSGMVQFKNLFTGFETRAYNKATSSQKSVRAGGKHNDLENVGYTSRHHTFFEMLGNFSFGDYFKEQAIYYAWDLLINLYCLPKNKIYVTVYHTDEETIRLWKKISGFGDDRILQISTNDNFWSMGETGPCGPCSEIFYDHGDKILGGLPGTPEQDGDRYIEIWNMVFMQFEQVDKLTRIELPKKSIDTGMGLERIATVLQNKHDNYDIDLFQELIHTSEELTNTKASGEAKFSHRVIADHLRASAFLIADGIMPSNEGRGYVLRRIMRRAMRHAHILGAKEPLLHKMLPTLNALMSVAYPELERSNDFISSILRQEEERFKTTLDRGLKLLEEEASNMSAGSILPGEIAFKLYDTYGFPLDLTEDILKSKNMTVDQGQFSAKMKEQKARAREAWVGSGEDKTDNLWFDIQNTHGSTEFLGYSLTESQGIVLNIVQDKKSLESFDKAGSEFIIITNQTPFYAESGGQMGDIGTVTSPTAIIKVIDTKKYLDNIHAHICQIESGTISVGDIVDLKIDKEYRNNLRAHHTATHILHAVLREVLGNHVVQKGSLVAHDRLRFDISHPNAITHKQKLLIEDKVNHTILTNSEITTVLMSTDEAIAKGAMALFGEKYASEVRVVSMCSDFSVELCGGTHATRTGEIGLFKITSEKAIAAGIRRIEAVTGKSCVEHIRHTDDTITKLSNILKVGCGELVEKITSLSQCNKRLEEELHSLKIANISFTKERLEKEAIKLSHSRVIYEIIENTDPKLMRVVAEDTARLAEDVIAIYVSKPGDKISIIVALGTKIATTKNASEIVKHIASLCGFDGGGGSSSLAQAGGLSIVDITKLKDQIIISL